VGELLLALRALRFQKSGLALDYLRSAEKCARQTLQPNMLDQALFLAVKHADKLNQPASEAIERWEENAPKLQVFRKMEMTYSRVREEISIAKKAGITPNVERIIKDVFMELHIGTDQSNNPEFMLRLVQAGRSVYVSVKDYKKIHPFVEEIYLRLKKANAFGPTHVACELEFMFILAHCYYRNRKFSDALKVLSDMETCIKNNKGVAMAIESRFISLKAAILSATGKNKNAIQIVETALAEKLPARDPAEHLSMQLNLATYYFNAGRFKEANAMLHKMPTDYKLREIKGREFSLKKNMIEMIVQFELGKDDIAETINKRILKSYAIMWKSPLYALSYQYMKFVGEIIKDSSIVDSPQFHKRIHQALQNSTIENEDLQAIAFYCWIKSKMTHRDYYEVLLERLNR
jgi:tetratricopeptide (TPR) repeat protein